MSTVFGFVVGYVVGARAGNPGFERVERALRDLRNSEEFRGFLLALKVHARETAQLLSERLQGDGPLMPDVEDLAVAGACPPQRVVGQGLISRPPARSDDSSAPSGRTAARSSMWVTNAQHAPAAMIDLAIRHVRRFTARAGDRR